MNIGDAAVRTGLPAKTIRYYEEIGLVSPLRGPNGYRRYRDTDAQKLQFLRRARALGFSIEQCRALVALWVDEGRASADVTAIARLHLDEVEAKIADLSAMRDTLAGLIRHCAADQGPDCAILEGLAGTGH
jgi:MerR family transcriptional regulator, copper efflux regulator